MFTLTYEYKLEPTFEQIENIENTLRVCRSVWNFALGYRRDWFKSRKSPINACSIEREYIMSVDEPFPNYHVQAKQLTEAKKDNDFLKSANAQGVCWKTNTDFAKVDKNGTPFLWRTYRQKSLRCSCPQLP